jgi:uncharacterized protein
LTLTDSGPLVAMLDRDDAYHERCIRVLPGLSTPMVTTLPALTEAMHFLGRQFGWNGQNSLWRMIRNGLLVIVQLDNELLERMAELMEQYRDSPMDIADASLVAIAEARGLRRIFTIDSHFYAYRLRNGHTLEVVPDRR